ncbi:hypothetical protein STEG23_038408 [Scotinomys teguina]
MLKDLIHCKLSSLFLDTFFNKFQEPQSFQDRSPATLLQVTLPPCGFAPPAPPSGTLVAKVADKGEYQAACTFGDRKTRPYHRPNCFYEKVKMEHKQVMSDLQRLKNDNRDASEKFRELTEEKGFYCKSQIVMIHCTAA